MLVVLSRKLRRLSFFILISPSCICAETSLAAPLLVFGLWNSLFPTRQPMGAEIILRFSSVLLVLSLFQQIDTTCYMTNKA